MLWESQDAEQMVPVLELLQLILLCYLEDPQIVLVPLPKTQFPTLNPPAKQILELKIPTDLRKFDLLD